MATPLPSFAHRRPRRKRAPSRGWNIQKRDTGAWLARVTDPHNLKRTAASFPTIAEAETWARETHAKLLLKQTAIIPKTKLQTIADDYLADLARTSRSSDYQANIKRIIASAITSGITDLTSLNICRQVTDWLSGLKTIADKPASPKTRNDYLLRLRTVAEWAVLHNKIERNELVKLKAQKVVEQKKEVFDLDEIGKLVNPAMSDHPFYRAFCCMVYTGYRQREVRFMDWSWILWDDMRIEMVLDERATQTLTAEEGQKILIPKSGIARGTRLMEELIAVLKPVAALSGPILPEYIGMYRGTFQDHFDRYVKDCGVVIKNRTPHSTRHTWTCLMLASNENQIMVQDYAGHSKSDMTKHYAKQQDRFRVRVRKAGWEPGELRLRDFSPGGKCYRETTGVVIQAPPAAPTSHTG